MGNKIRTGVPSGPSVFPNGLFSFPEREKIGVDAENLLPVCLKTGMKQV